MIASQGLAPLNPDVGCRRVQLAGMMAYLRQILTATHTDEEQFHAIFLDAGRGYLDDCRMGSGNSAHMPIRLRELFAKALSLGASGIIVAHNHPSGDCRPSQSDVAATRRLVEIGRALDIELLDHLIVTRERVYSMRAGGKL